MLHYTLLTYNDNRPECSAACELWFPQSSAATSTASSSSSDSSQLQHSDTAATTTTTATAAKPFSSVAQCTAACISDTVPWGFEYVKCLESAQFRVGTKQQLCRAVGADSGSVMAPQVLHTKVS
jgi:hypothetical protein